MKRTLLLLLALAFAVPSFGAHRRDIDSASLPHSGWIASGGFGLTVSPTTVLINPQLEYMIHHNLFVGVMMQAGLGDVTLFTTSGTVRYLFDTNSILKPTLETGFGFAVGSSSFASSAGIEFHFGMGVDFAIDRSMSIGTMIRANFAPPLQTFFLSWPIIMARFYI
jgi:hypothetical protein